MRGEGGRERERGRERKAADPEIEKAKWRKMKKRIEGRRNRSNI